MMSPLDFRSRESHAHRRQELPRVLPESIEKLLFDFIAEKFAGPDKDPRDQTHA